MGASIENLIVTCSQSNFLLYAMNSTSTRTNTITTSEDVVKSLESKVSHERKLAIALTTWDSPNIIFPNKAEYLADWVSSSLVKSCSKKKSKRQVNDKYDKNYP